MRGAWTKPAPAGGESSPPLSEGQEPQAQSVGGALHEWPVIRNMSRARRTQAPGREPDDAAVSEGCARVRPAGRFPEHASWTRGTVIKRPPALSRDDKAGESVGSGGVGMSDRTMTGGNARLNSPAADAEAAASVLADYRNHGLDGSSSCSATATGTAIAVAMAPPTIQGFLIHWPIRERA
ncbi:MAG: hypothetical protein KatS3mg112_0761 [Thermogutta sp.]|nr:MAG: hypothetical protein KatS3mg112_0761 [Thermogutta sp.]